jgi:virulence factor Mce-like protein
MPARRTATKRRHSPRHFGIVGVVGILALLAAVVISYRANSGLPFQPSYRVFVDVPNADRLNHYADVRIGGVRVGEVQSLAAVPGTRAAKPFGRLELSLSPSVGRLPVDSRVQIRSASVLGATYVDLTPGHSSRKLAAGGTLPLSQVASTVQLTDLLDVFDHSTATSIRNVLGGLGDGLAGRGDDLNWAITSLAGLAEPLTRVLGAFASPQAELAGFLHGYELTVGALAPVSSQLSGLIADAATTFGALSAARTALGQTIDALPVAESATTTALADLRPALRGLARLARDLRPGAALLPTTLPALNRALAAGVAPLTAVPAFARGLRGTLRALDAVGADPAATGALRQLTAAVSAINQLLVKLTPAQVGCNILGIWGRNFASGLAGSGVAGVPLVQVAVATLGASNEIFQNASPSPNMHVDADPVENYQQCQAGNEPYNAHTQLLSNPPGVLSNQTAATSPPAGVRALAAKAGLLNTPPGTP